MAPCFVDLYWLPVGAGTISRARKFSLDCWEAAAALLARRPRAALYHSALKVSVDGVVRSVEVTPEFAGEDDSAAMTGPVGLRAAGRWRIFRYQLRCGEGPLPDEEYVAGEPLRLASDCGTAERLMLLTSLVPPYTWGRRAPGASEMWTSDSAISWLLVRAGMDLSGVTPPPGGRAPGWAAGMEIAAART